MRLCVTRRSLFRILRDMKKINYIPDALSLPQIIDAFIGVRGGKRKLAKDIGITTNTLESWVKKPEKARLGPVQDIVEIAIANKIPAALEWQELVLAEDHPCVTLRDGGIEDTQYFVCERRAAIKRGQLIIHEGELCEIMGVNNKQKLQAVGKFTHNIYELEKPPGHAVIGRFLEIPSQEAGPDIIMPGDKTQEEKP